MKSTKNKRKKKTHFRKEDANRKSSILFTQLGLVLALLLVYIVIESKTPVNDDFTGIPNTFYSDDTLIPDTTPEKPKPKKVVKSIPEPEPKLIDIKIIKNDSPIDETVFTPKDPETGVELHRDSIPYIPIIEEVVEDVPFVLIENAPLFPGCKGTKSELKQCFSDSVRKLIGKKFNGDIAQEIGLTAGKKRIIVQFTVDKYGNIADVLVKAPHKRLEKETERVVNLLPKMEPGKQRGRPVGVKFALPITFRVE